MNGSADLGEIISKLTENPEMMKTLMGVAGNIMKTGENDYVQAAYAPSNKHTDKEECCGFDIADKPDINKPHHDSGREECATKRGKKGDDAENLIRLLLALRPFVSPERCNKIDSVVKILKLIQLSDKSGLLKSLI